MKITSKQRAFLKKKAHNLEPIIRVGKEEISENFIKGVLEVITPRELIKIKMLQNSEKEKNEVATLISTKVDAQIVGIIGKTIILFKENKEKPVISEELKTIK